MATTPTDVTKDMLARVKRIETRMMRLCTHLGVDPTENRERMRYDAAATAILMDGYGTTVGDIVDFCRKSGIINTAVGLRVRDTYIGVISIGEKTP
jgi:hypothetical protein